MGDSGLAELLKERGIQDPDVLRAISNLNRGDFVPEAFGSAATEDIPLPIGQGQTISQPFVVAYMTEQLLLQPHHRVLEIGTGSGYQAAVLAQLAAEVYSIEIIPSLAKRAAERLARLGFDNVHLRVGDGSEGWPEAAPFEAILLTAAPEKIPSGLLTQLAPGGRLLAPVGASEGYQEIVLIEKDDEGVSRFERLIPVRFVPLSHHAAPGSPGAL